MISIVLAPLSLGIAIGILVSYIICKQEAMIIDIPLGFQVSLLISLCTLISTLIFLMITMC